MAAQQKKIESDIKQVYKVDYTEAEMKLKVGREVNVREARHLGGCRLEII